MKVQRLLTASVISVLLFAAGTQAQNNGGNGNTDTTASPRSTRGPIATSRTSNTDNLPTASPTPTASSTSSTVLGVNTDLPATDAPLPKATLPFTIPVITPPPTKNAPFMQQSKYPEGTVFIAVGAVLGVCVLILLAWRGLVAWALHRSVQRANNKQGLIDSKPLGGNGGGNGGFYGAGAGSMHSLDHLASTNRSPGLPPPNSSLFFSPTSNQAAPPNAGADRRSQYLPPGFYAANSANRKSFVASNSRLGISPPGTPLMAPVSRRASSVGTDRMPGVRVNDSQISLNVLPTGRAPSAYLEDLFENHHQTPDHRRY
ncbi:hypothetical protein FPQ18DRAFT_322089 [Pyronema domesticum]|uniref:Uncharacterized protein n=1 Tax=Pyronema omphalodes (strain CBS 100304) TaxID=1076935 RepID=U4LVS3_PYROM|nr:hypothetical protein FPQ18DRAFT_322089 [Pyronema domesticum]CCX32786.1 Similar to hypothetical protein [Tuber melanosporum Mel28]; acc. no. XP_002840833 [Pyronema omphalodes CBS 100304]